MEVRTIVERKSRRVIPSPRPNEIPLLLELRYFLNPIISNLVNLSYAKSSIILSCLGSEQAPILFESLPIARDLFEP